MTTPIISTATSAGVEYSEVAGNHTPSINYPSTTTQDGNDTTGGLDKVHIAIIVAVLVGVLLITAVILYILFRKRRSQGLQTKQQAAGGGVYQPTTAPLDEESRGMLKSGAGEQTEMQEKLRNENGKNNGTKEVTDEASPLKESGPTVVIDPNESSATLVNNDANATA